MWIVKLDNGKYKYTERYKTIDNKTKYASVTLKSNSPQAQKQAQKLISAKINEKKTVLAPKRHSYDFTQLAAEWIEIKQKSVKKSTISNYLSIISVLNTKIGTLPIDQLSAGVINRMFLDMSNSGITYKTVSERYKILKQIIQFALDYEYIDDYPLLSKIKIEKINVSPKNEDKYLEPHEAESLFKKMTDEGYEELADFFNLQMQTGMRFGEVASIHIPDIDLINHTLNIQYTYDAVNKLFTLPKGNKIRLININNDTVELIKKIQRRRKLLLMAYGIRDNNLLFFSSNGEPLNYGTSANILHQFETSDKKLTTHIFRHTFVTRMIENNVSANLIAQHIGQVGTTLIDNVYSHFSDKMNNELKEAINSFKI